MDDGGKFLNIEQHENWFFFIFCNHWKLRKLCFSVLYWLTSKSLVRLPKKISCSSTWNVWWVFHHSNLSMRVVNSSIILRVFSRVKSPFSMRRLLENFSVMMIWRVRGKNNPLKSLWVSVCMYKKILYVKMQ